MAYNESIHKIFKRNYKGSNNLKYSQLYTNLHYSVLSSKWGPSTLLWFIYNRSEIKSQNKNNNKIEDNFFKLYYEIKKSQ